MPSDHSYTLTPERVEELDGRRRRLLALADELANEDRRELAHDVAYAVGLMDGHLRLARDIIGSEAAG